MTDLAKLVVKLEAQTAQYMNALDAANRKLDKFNKDASISAKGIGQAFVAVAVSAATAMAALTKESIDSADRFLELSQATGITVESLSQMELAAKQSGIDIEQLAISVGKMQRVQVEAARGGEKAARAFDTIGVAVENADGTLRATEDVLLDVADRFAKMEDGAAKAAIAQELFGKSGAKLIPFLNQGRKGIEALKKEADALGLTITTKAATAADKFNDNLTTLGGAAKGLGNQFVEEILPTLLGITDRFIKAAKAGGALDFAVKALGVTFKAFVTAGVIVTSIFQQLGRVIYGVGAALVRIANGEFSMAAQELKDAFAEASENVTNDIETIVGVWQDAETPMAETAANIDETLGETILFNPKEAEEKARKAMEAAMSSLAGLEQSLQQQVETFGMSDAAVMKYRVTVGDLATVFDAAGEAGAIYKDTIVALAESLEEKTKKQEADNKAQAEWDKLVEEGARVTESVMTPAEEYSKTIERLNFLLEKGVISQETYNRAVEGAQDAFDKATKAENKFLKQANRNVQDILADGITNALHDGFSNGAKGALEAFGQMLEKMAAQALAAKLAEKIFGGEGMGGGGGWIDSLFNFGAKIFGGSRDQGGRGRAGVAYRIGLDEEYYVPDRPGMFVTPDQIGGSTVNQTINVVGQVSQRSARQLELEAARRQRTAAARIG